MLTFVEDDETYLVPRSTKQRTFDKMREAMPAQKIAGGVRKSAPRSFGKSSLQAPATLPNPSLEAGTAQLEIDAEEPLRLERHTRLATQRRQDELQRLLPTNVKPHRRNMNPTKRGSTPIIQPGGGFRGN